MKINNEIFASSIYPVNVPYISEYISDAGNC